MTVATLKGQIAVIEVLGLPGSGKTTVVDAVSQSHGIEVMSRYRSPANAVPYAIAALELLPVLVPSLWQGRSWRERNKLIRLASSRSVVRRRARGGTARAFVFDQGPLFLLKQLADDGGPPDAIERRRRRLASSWGRTLDLALVLDAPDDVLLERIRGRDKGHQLRDEADASARAALATERRAVERVLEELGGEGTVRIQRVDTSASTVADTTAALLRGARVAATT